MIDIHLHTKISYDSSENPENYIAAAKNLGIKTLTFSEHCDYDVYLEEGGPLPDFKEYDMEINRLKNNFPDMNILKGVELGYSRDALPYYRDLVASEGFDCVILSVHTLRGRGDCYFPKFFDGLEREQAFALYLNALSESVSCGLDFDVIGHMGYISRYAPYEDRALRYSEFSELWDNILKGLIERGKCLEVNTSANGSSEATLPPREIIKRYFELGGRFVSFGSDAHTAADFCRGEGEAKAILRDIGFEEGCYFEGRRRKIYKI